MAFQRIIASEDVRRDPGDPGLRIVIAAAVTSENHLLPEADAAFGYLYDWDDESENYLRYPFVLEPIDAKHARLSWGDFDETRTELDVMGRRLVVGETFTRRENNESTVYRIHSIEAVEG